MNLPAIATFTGMLILVSQAHAQEPFIAGVVPNERPQGAPVVREVVRDANWLPRALTGVDEPIPASLNFLSDQGNWFTPFNHPGMIGPYDIREWHTASTNNTP